MTLFDFLAWAVSGSFWRFGGTVVIIVVSGWSVMASGSAVAGAFANIVGAWKK